jgi:hypothetical protein
MDSLRANTQSQAIAHTVRAKIANAGGSARGRLGYTAALLTLLVRRDTYDGERTSRRRTEHSVRKQSPRPPQTHKRQYMYSTRVVQCTTVHTRTQRRRVRELENHTHYSYKRSFPRTNRSSNLNSQAQRTHTPQPPKTFTSIFIRETKHLNHSTKVNKD